jgi:hypothetical protein
MSSVDESIRGWAELDGSALGLLATRGAGLGKKASVDNTGRWYLVSLIVPLLTRLWR